MLHRMLLILSVQPTCFCALYYLHKVLPMKHPLGYCAASMGTMALLSILNQILLPRPVFLLNLILLFSSFFYLFFFADRQYRMMSLFTHAMIMALMMISANIAARVLIFLSPLVGIDPARLIRQEDPSHLLFSLAIGLMIIPVLLLFTSGLQRLLRSVHESRYLLWFLTIPFSQVTLLLMVVGHLEEINSIQVWVTILAGGLLCLAADIACILGCRKFHELEQMTLRVRQAEQQLNIQNESFRELQDNILKVNKIRHDLVNQLTAAYHLLEQGHPEEVRSQLDSLSSCVQDHIGTQYCENLMVDTVLQEKAALCSQKNIPLECSCLVPADLCIDSAHLCSTFSNLLDNCVAAAARYGPGAGPIRIRSDIRKGYLIITCSNPSVPPQQERKQDIMRRHGLGLEILGSLARLHQGSFQTEFRDGRFYVTMTLKNEKSTPSEG